MSSFTHEQSFQSFLTQRRGELSRGRKLFYTYVLLGISSGALLMIPNTLFVASSIFKDHGNFATTALSFFLLFNLLVIPVYGLLYSLMLMFRHKEEIIEYLSSDYLRSAQIFYNEILPNQLAKKYSYRELNPKKILTNSQQLRKPYILTYQNSTLNISRNTTPTKEIMDIKLSARIDNDTAICIASSGTNKSTKDIITIQTSRRLPFKDGKMIHEFYNDMHTYLFETQSITKPTTSIKKYLNTLNKILSQI